MIGFIGLIIMVVRGVEGQCQNATGSPGFCVDDSDPQSYHLCPPDRLQDDATNVCGFKEVR